MRRTAITGCRRIGSHLTAKSYLMSNFVRALKMSLRYHWTIAGIVACALVVAVLWGANIGAMYPCLDVIFKGQSLSQGIDQRIAESERLERELGQEIASSERSHCRRPGRRESAARGRGRSQAGTRRGRTEGSLVVSLGEAHASIGMPPAIRFKRWSC